MPLRSPVPGGSPCATHFAPPSVELRMMLLWKVGFDPTTTQSLVEGHEIPVGDAAPAGSTCADHTMPASLVEKNELVPAKEFSPNEKHRVIDGQAMPLRPVMPVVSFWMVQL